MKIIIKFIKNLSLFKKMMAAYSFIGLILIIISILLCSISSLKFIREENTSIAQRNLSLIVDNMSSKINTINKFSQLILANQTVQNLLNDKKQFTSIQGIKTLNPLFLSFLAMVPDVSSITVFNNEGNYFGHDIYKPVKYSFSQLNEAPWYDSVINLDGYYKILLNAGYPLPLNGNKNVVSVIRSVYDLNKQSSFLGMLVINLDETFFTNCFNNENDNSTYITVIDKSGRSIISGERNVLYSTKLITEGINLNKKKKKISACMAIPETEWYVVQSISYDSDIKTMIYSNKMFIILPIIIVILLFIVTIVMKYLITKPIHELTKAMQSHQVGKYLKDDDISRKDEIGVLIRTYNSMLTSLKEEGIRKREAELYALQMQVKPHFLYNTIDTARALVLSGNSKGANTVLLSLGQFYRDSICGDSEIILLRNEIDMIKNYLTIQKIRYGDLFEVEYDIDETLLSKSVLKLILQPIVENALYHGIRESGHAGIIKIELWKEAEYFYLSVADNGVGISEDKRKQLMEGRFSQKDKKCVKGEGIGLCGTIDRLKLFYHIDNPLQIESSLGKGTKVIIKLMEI